MHFPAIAMVAKSNEGRQEISVKENWFHFQEKKKMMLEKGNLKAIQKLLELQAV